MYTNLTYHLPAASSVTSATPSGPYGDTLRQRPTALLPTPHTSGSPPGAHQPAAHPERRIAPTAYGFSKSTISADTENHVEVLARGVPT